MGIVLSDYGFGDGQVTRNSPVCLKKDRLMASKDEHAHSTTGLDTDLVRDSSYSQPNASARRYGDST